MGKLNQGAFQGFIGKTGGLVGKRYQGKYIISAYQPIVKNPKSEKQTSQRDNFAAAIKYVRDTFNKEITNANWKAFSGGLTGRASTIQAILSVITFYNRYLPNQFSPKAPPQLLSGMVSRGSNPRPDLIGNWIKQASPATGYAINDALGAYEPGVKYFGSNVPLGNFKCHVDYSSIVNGAVQWNTVEGEAFSDLILQDKSTIADLVVGKNYGIRQTAAELGDGWNYIYKFNDAQVFPVVPATVSKTVYQGEDGNLTGGKWKDSQFIVSLIFDNNTAINSEVANNTIVYTPAP